jgi:transglycosylase-like protein with SLT domain
MPDYAMAPHGAAVRVVRPLGGEAAISCSAAPVALGRPFFVSVVLALGLSSVIVALGRNVDSTRLSRLAVAAPTIVQRIMRRDDDSLPVVKTAIRLDLPPLPLESDPPLDDAPALPNQDTLNPNAKLRFGSRHIERWLVDTLRDAARTVDADPALLMAIADKESSFSPTAKARTSSAEGLFQFIDRTWLRVVRDFGAKHGLEAEAAAIAYDSDGYLAVADGAMRARIMRLRRDPRVASIMAAEMLKRDSEQIAQRVGRSLSSGEVYLAHFLGPVDAARFIAKVEDQPNAVAAKLLPRPARANRPIFFASRRRRAKSLSVAEVHRKFEEMMQTRLERFRSVDQGAPEPTTVSEASPR